MLSIGKRLRKIIRLLLLIFYILKEIEICTAYILKINSNCEKKLILLMIPNKKKRRLALSCSKKTICIY